MKGLKVCCDIRGIKEAFQIINQGGIAIFPTDTVYGIGCDPYIKKSVENIYKIKSRDISKPLPVLVDSKETAEKIALFDQSSTKLAAKFWPGPLTMILKLLDKDLKESLNLTDKIAVRVPNHKCTLKLLKKCNILVGTSANISGQLPFTDPKKCIKYIKEYDVFIDGGMIISKLESTIIEVNDNQKINIIREGAINKEIITKL